MGLVAALPAVAAARRRAAPLRAIARATPFALAVAASLVYRRTIGPTVLHLPDNKSGVLSFAPGDMANVAIHGIVMQLIGGWIAAASSTFHLAPAAVILPISFALLAMFL